MEGDGEAMRLVPDALQQVQRLRCCADRITGSASPGTHTSSRRFASPITAMSVTPISAIAAAAALT